jgi:hypothetical protein
MLSSRVLDIPRIERHQARGNLLISSIIGRSRGSSKLWITLSRSAVFTSTTRLDRGCPVQLVYVCKMDLISDITNAVLAQLKVAASASLNNTGVMLRAFIALGSVYRNLLPLGVRHAARVGRTSWGSLGIMSKVQRRTHTSSGNGGGSAWYSLSQLWGDDQGTRWSLCEIREDWLVVCAI